VPGRILAADGSKCVCVLGWQAQNAYLLDSGVIWHSDRGQSRSASSKQCVPRNHPVFCIYQYLGREGGHLTQVSMLNWMLGCMLLRWLRELSSFSGM
jgi:hypothetical protein